MRIRHVAPGSAAERSGLLAGETLVSINGAPIRDLLDYHFQVADGDLEIVVAAREGTRRSVEVSLEEGADLGLTVDPLKTRLCGNECVFCFVDQNPDGMRETIYVKDEDYRLSFLHGNFVTLTNLKKWELERIVAQRLSPLYVSVHSTSRETRRSLLRPGAERDILTLIGFLVENGITLHTQIVLCPGYNDGEDLDRTIRDLANRWPGVASLAVVPLGLTEHRRQCVPLEPVTCSIAGEVREQVERHAADFRREHGIGFVYLADEFYRLLDLEVPPAAAYDGFPQLENGIGMTRKFLDRIAEVERLFHSPPVRSGEEVTLATGELFAPILEQAVARTLERTGEGVVARVVGCSNRFFGRSVTVAGLLAGGDLARALEGRNLGRRVYIPPATLNGEGLFLDDTTRAELAERLGVPVEVGLLSS